MNFPLIVAHRGDTKHAPENTLSAFELAITKGVDGIEFDLHETRDGELVVLHDYTLDRTTSGNGLVSHCTFKELRALDAGRWFDLKFAGEMIPTLNEVIEIGKGKTRFEIELLCATLSFLKDVIQKLKDQNVTDDVEITSPHIPLLGHVRSFQKGLRVGYFVPLFPAWKTPNLGNQHLIQWMKLMDAQVAHLPPSMLNESTVNILHENEYLVHGANLNNAQEFQRALRLNIDQFSTDEIDLAMDLRQRHHANATR
jgi:glycerophosphoryl diester phosphodiesterase